MIKKCAFLLLTLASLSIPSVLANASTKQLFGYYTNWDDYGRAFAPENIPMNQISAVLYAFAQVGNCATPYATDDKPTLCNANSKAGLTGQQDYKLYSTDPWADYTAKESQYGGKGLIDQTIQLAHQQGKKALLSIGGWTLSVPLTTAMDQTHQQVFIASIVEFVTKAGFDGVDIDWEPNQNAWSIGTSLYRVTPQQFSNYLSFLSNLHAALKATKLGSTAWLTVAITANPAAVNAMPTSFLKNLAKNVNYIDIMAYDYHGAFDNPPISNFLAGLLPDPQEPAGTTGHGTFNVQTSVQAYLNAGVPAQQLVVGFPLYSRSVNIIPAKQNTLKKSLKNSTLHAANAYPGLYQNFNPSIMPAGEWGDDGVWDYKKIQTTLLNNGYIEYAYPVAKTIIGAFAFNPATHVFMSYDNIDSLTAKIQFVQNKQLGGMMAWELSGDLPSTDPKSLVALTAKKLN